jgi:hypothetical protein
MTFAVTPLSLLQADVPNAGTFALRYPAGYSQGSGWDSDDHVLVDDRGNLYTTGFTVTFGASLIAITNTSLGILTGGRSFRLQAQRLLSEFEAVFLRPSGDTSGNTDYAAFQAVLTANDNASSRGVRMRALFVPGDYYFSGNPLAKKTVIVESLCGAYSTQINLVGAGRAFLTLAPAAAQEPVMGTRVRGFYIDGQAGGNDGLVIVNDPSVSMSACDFEELIFYTVRDGVNETSSAGNEFYNNRFANLQCIGPALTAFSRYAYSFTNGAYLKLEVLEFTGGSNAAYGLDIRGLNSSKLNDLHGDTVCFIDAPYSTIDKLTIETIAQTAPPQGICVIFNNLKRARDVKLLNVNGARCANGIKVVTAGMLIDGYNISGGSITNPLESNSVNSGTMLNATGSAGAGATAAQLAGWTFIDCPLMVTGGTRLSDGLAGAAGLGTPTVFHSGGIGANSATMGTDTTPIVTETYIAEVFIPANCTLTGVSVLNGSAVAGDMQIALADSSGAVVAQTASTAAAGTAAFQKVPFTATYAAKGPAKYYILLQNDNVANRFRSHAVGNFGASKKTGETFGTFTTVTPPTTFTANLGPVADVY